MSWFSILPSSLTAVETWLVRLFLLLGALTIGPWALLILYDFLLYCARCATYEVPVIGGRARGRQRPRAPSLSERPSGRPRRFSFVPSSMVSEGARGASSPSSSSSSLASPSRVYRSDGFDERGTEALKRRVQKNGSTIGHRHYRSL